MKTVIEDAAQEAGMDIDAFRAGAEWALAQAEGYFGDDGSDVRSADEVRNELRRLMKWLAWDYRMMPDGQAWLACPCEKKPRHDGRMPLLALDDGTRLHVRVYASGKWQCRNCGVERIMD